MKWDYRFLDLAAVVASWSRDSSTQVGAVIADPDHRVVSLGFNGLPRGLEDGDLPRDDKLRKVIHAEENAILFASRPLEDCSIYITHPPCARCAAKIIQTGIARVVFWNPSEAFAERWAADIIAAHEMFNESGVEWAGYEP